MTTGTGVAQTRTVGNNPRFFPLLVAVVTAACFVVLWARAIRVEAVADLMVGEDAAFLSQAEAAGIVSLILPYMGYLHTPVRIVAYAASLVDYGWQPTVCFAGTLLIYALAIVILLQNLLSLNLRPLLAGAAVLLIFLQPTDRYTLLGLSTVQWVTGTALTAYALGYRGTNSRIMNWLVVILFGLNGPFAVFLAPFVVLKLFIVKSENNRELHWGLFVAALLQLGCTLFSPRVAGDVAAVGASLTVFREFLASLFRMSVFEMTGSGSLYSVGLVVSAMIAAFALNLKRDDTPDCPENRLVLAWIVVVALFLASTLVAASRLTPEFFDLYTREYGHNQRYLFFPHSMLVLAAFVLARRRPVCAALSAFGFLGLFIANLTMLDRDPTYFRSFLNFSRFRPVYWTINPLKTENRTSIWMLRFARKTLEPLDPARVFQVGGEDLTSNDADITGDTGRLTAAFSGDRKSALLTYSRAVDCSATSDIGLDMVFSESSAVRLDLVVEPLSGNGPAHISTIYHNFVEEHLQMAVPHIGVPARLSLRVSDNSRPWERPPASVSVNLNRMTFFCLPAR
ncbi:MAG: hypothetical protein LBR29_00170 [Methylobacteriaceae bacterium]|jgi:hypothetical protein|nr:hypothetical protein [Methylobacteriaceae bacterium]